MVLASETRSTVHICCNTLLSEATNSQEHERSKDKLSGLVCGQRQKGEDVQVVCGLYDGTGNKPALPVPHKVEPLGKRGRMCKLELQQLIPNKLDLLKEAAIAALLHGGESKERLPGVLMLEKRAQLSTVGGSPCYAMEAHNRHKRRGLEHRQAHHKRNSGEEMAHSARGHVQKAAFCNSGRRPP